jgi:transposase-like protein
MRLTTEQIHEILVAVDKGETYSSIARRFSVDNATVRYQVEKFERTYGSTEAVYAVIRPVQRICTHPSCKCLVCGQAQDMIRRRELDEIRTLKARIVELEGMLPVAPVEEIGGV